LTVVQLVAVVLTSVGALFFLAGTVGLLRFPDALSRLHALTKADNLGLGCIAVGLAVYVGSLPVALKLGAIWALVLLSSSTSCYLIANDAARRVEAGDDAG